jgi:hypothetical protein
MMVFSYKKIMFFLLLKGPLLYFAQSLKKLRDAPGYTVSNFWAKIKKIK